MDYRTKITYIKSQFLAGEITIEEAKARVGLLLVEMNKINKKIAKKHGKHYKELTFTYVFR